jgi:hypothetical protein
MGDIGSFYSSVKDWAHDQHLFIVILMIQQGIMLDFGQLNNTQLTVEDNAINLVCGVISLLDVELGEPWESFELQEDETVKAFYYLANLIRDSINNFIESILFRAIVNQKLISHSLYQQLHNQIKFKPSNGLYFATVLKSILQYSFPANMGEKPAFKDMNWPWLKYTSVDNFVDVLKEALTLWDSVFKMVIDLSEKSRIEHLGIAFSNANYILKSKIKELGISELL